MVEAPKFKSALLEAEAAAKEQRQVAEDTLRVEWGDVDYAANIHAINAHLDAMAPADRQKFERVNDRGIHALNDPAVLRELATAARQAPASLAEAVKKHGGDERAAIEELMRKDRKAYRADPRIELHYRALLDAALAEAPGVQDYYEKTPADLEKALAYVRAASSSSGFSEAAFIRKEVAARIAKGMTPARARAVVEHVLQRARSSR